MSWWHPDKFEQKRPYLEKRADLIRATREFFESEGFAEVQTPVLQVMPTADPHIHGFQTTLKGTDLAPIRNMYLHCSPEFAMKKLLVAGMEKIYQICPVFRNGEDSSLHSPEFTMLEWYRTGADYRSLMDDCTRLVQKIAEKLDISQLTYKTHTANPFLKWNIISIVEAFDKYSKIDLIKFLPPHPNPLPWGRGSPNGMRTGEGVSAFREAVAAIDIRVTEDDDWDDIFFRVMAEKIEPNLGIGAPTILYDYPAHMAALSRKKPDDSRFAERFELYICGLEIANAFSELTDAAEQRARFEADMSLKQKLYGESYPIDEEFLQALEYGLPDCAGIALGIDRLAMLFSGAEDINQVLWAQV